MEGSAHGAEKMFSEAGTVLVLKAVGVREFVCIERVVSRWVGKLVGGFRVCAGG